MSYPIGLQVLRAKIRGFQEAGTTITSRISKAEKERKNSLWNQKRSLGVHCRHHLVAYGLLRGVPYNQIERCAPNNKLNAKVVLDIMQAHNGWDSKMEYVNYDLEAVKMLLMPPSVPVSVATPIPVTAVENEVSLLPTKPPSPGLLERARALFEKWV